MRKTRLLVPVVLAAVLALLAWWPLGRQEQAPERPAPVEAGQIADYYLRDFTVTRSDEAGRWDYKIQAARMLHYPQSESWTLEAPTMTLFSERGAPWHGRAEHGRIWAEGDEALLGGAVELWRPASPQNRPVTVDTRDLYLKPGERYGETQAPVLVRQAGRGQLRGVGARVYLNEERYELLSQVKGQFEPASQ